MNDEDADRKAWELLNETADSIEFPDYVQTVKHHDGTLSFSLTLNFASGTFAQISYTPSIEMVRELLLLEVDPYIEIPGQLGRHSIKAQSYTFVSLFLQNFHGELKSAVSGLTEIPSLLLSVDRKLLQLTLEGAQMQSASSRITAEPVFKDALEVFLTKRKDRTKKRILEQVEIRNRKLQPAKHLISYFYKKLLPSWRKAKANYAKYKDSDKWERHIALETEDLPIDLVLRMKPNDRFDSTPSSIALEHAARFCGIQENSIGLRGLQKYLKTSQEWAKSTNSEVVSEEIEYHYRMALFQLKSAYEIAELAGLSEFFPGRTSPLCQLAAERWGWDTVDRLKEAVLSKINSEQEEDERVH
jgi:hypothetical protein